jgi:hypothetical protein
MSLAYFGVFLLVHKMSAIYKWQNRNFSADIIRKQCLNQQYHKFDITVESLGFVWIFSLHLECVSKGGVD